MSVITFHTTIHEGIIQIPEEYREQLPPQVQVIVLPDETEPQAVDFIAQLLAHPLDCPEFRPFPREELYARP